jgi:hypothetical protein
MNYSLEKRKLLPVMLAALLPAGMFAQFHITPGANVVVQGPANIVINNMSLNNDGNFVAGNSTVRFTGIDPAVPPTIYGASTPVFYNLVINKPSGQVSLYQNITITDTITMADGILQLNGHTCVLGYSAIILGEGEKSYIWGGSIMTQRNLIAPTGINPGNIGLEFTTPDNIGWVSIIRTNALYTSNDKRISIGRAYSVTPMITLPAPSLTIRFHYLDVDLAGNNEDKLALWSGTPLQLVAGTNDILDGVNNVITETGISFINYFTAGSADAVFARKAIVVAPEIKQVDADPGVNKLVVSPNPSRNRFVLTLSANKAGADVAGLYGFAGNLLQRKVISYNTGITRIEWDMSKYAAGIYYLRFEKQAFKNTTIVKR